MYSVFTSQTGTVGPKFASVKSAEQFARKLGIDAQIFDDSNNFKVVKWIFKKRRG
jgi:geranylgeranyl pyrophosphate synthase